MGYKYKTKSKFDAQNTEIRGKSFFSVLYINYQKFG